MATEWSPGNRICAAPWPKEAAETACVPRPPSRALHALMASAARRSSGRHTSWLTTPSAAQRRCVPAALRGFRPSRAGLGRETLRPAGSGLGDATAAISHRGGVGKRGSLRLQGLSTASGQPQQRPQVSAGQRARPVPGPPSSPAGPGPEGLEGPGGAGCVLRLSALSA
ncbi:collagen alpha-1(I) chain-like [Pongo abelii]|uniref:collagen alpha-1(I) chain-like n=1 Tax=Pongo abelii TaxID=9601 RepID=UPI003004AF12